MRDLRVLAIGAVLAMVALGAGGQPADAQENAAPGPAEASISPQPTPVPLIAPLSLSLQPVPAYGVAPLTVGFFVKAVDPENAGFIRYEWNFGDGHISTLPPLMAFETYQTPGTYMVTLTAVTPDGRSASAFAGVLVRSPSLQ